MDEQQGAYLVSLARRTVKSYLTMGKFPESPREDWLLQKRGVFVSIYTYPLKELRGCIGFPLPLFKLSEATMKAAVAAATEDPRFYPLTVTELSSVVFEVSVLTEPVEIKSPKRGELPGLIKIGEDGLIIETPYGSGLLLPQVPVEYDWNAEEYLSNLCIKAGLEPTYWLYGEMKLLKFGAEVFAEPSPEAKAVRLKLAEKRC